MTAPLLSVRDLRVHFPVRRGTLRAVDGISFDLAPGETLGIVGESGCGKSTLGRAILQLVRPTQGRVVWMGQELTTTPDEALRPLRREMTVIFQDPVAALDPRMTVGDIVAEPLVTHEPRLPGRERRDRVADMMARVGLAPEMINRYPHEFSGGQAQRIGIARAMILAPKLVICDEPVSALDVSIQAQIVNLLAGLQRDLGVAMLFISHDLAVVRLISHRVLVLYLGKPMELATRDALYAKPRHPYTQALISAVPVPDPKVERTRKRIVLVGDLPSPLAPPSGCVFRTRCPRAQAVCAAEEPAFTGGVACHFAEEHGLGT